jgi:hypothetical protein
MSNKQASIDRAGAELVAASRGDSEESLPLSTRLFPYFFVASRRMSLRSISRWLADNHGVQLSAAAISRALANPKLHLGRLAESISAPARYVATAYGFDPLNLLYGRVTENGPSEICILADHTHKQPESETDIPRWQELQDLAEVWEPIPHEVQLLLEPYLREEFQSEETEIHDDDSTEPDHP